MARTFDGSSAYLTVSDNNFDGLSSGTIVIWFKSTYSAAYQKILKKASCIDVGINQDFGGGEEVFAEIVGVGNLGTFGSTNPSDGAWHCILIYWDGSDIYGYLDGTQKKTTTQSGSQNDNGNTLYIGSTESPNEYFNGQLAELAMWDKAVNAGEIAALSAGYSPMFFRDNLLLYLPITGRYATEIDYSGNGNSASDNSTSYADHLNIIYPGGLLSGRAEGITTQTVELTTDGIVLVETTKTLTADGIVLEETTKTFTADGIVLAETTKTFTADGIILAETTKTFTADGIIKTEVTTDFTADGVVLVEQTKTFTTDGVVKEVNTKIFTADGLIVGQNIKDLTIDAIISAVNTLSITVDGMVGTTKGHGLPSKHPPGYYDKSGFRPLYSQNPLARKLGLE